MSDITPAKALSCPCPAMEVCAQASGSPVEGGSEKASGRRMEGAEGVKNDVISSCGKWWEHNIQQACDLAHHVLDPQ